MAEGISIVLIDSDADSVGRIQHYIKDLGDRVSVAGVAKDFEAGFELVHRKKPNVVIMEAENGVDKSIEKLDMILSRFPQTSVFVTSADKSSETILKFMRAGATEYILRPVSETHISAALQKLGRLWIVKPGTEVETGRIYSVFSPKGGVGVTTVAINLATGLFDVNGASTVLVDFDLNAGDVSTFLNLKPAYTISDVTSNISRLDKSFLQDVLTKHESGIHVLGEPRKVEEGVSISAAELKRVLVLLKGMFQNVVVDTEAVFNERTTAAIEMSDAIFLVFILSLPGIKNMQRHLSYLEKLGVRKDKIKLVVNRYQKKGHIKIEDAEKVLNFQIFFSLPNDFDNAMTCLNKGEPLNMCAPRSQLTAATKELAKAIIEIKK